MNKRNWRPFEEAREFARSLGFSTYLEWEEYAKSGNKPADIPAQPRVVYKNDGWRGAADWVGREWRTFEEAREFVRSLGLKTGDEWREYYKSGQKPDDIPAEPRSAYKGQFLGWGDWLGSGYVSTSRRKFRPFEEAREFARSLGLGSAKEWHSYSKSGNRPADIPSNPDRIYKEHWLGYGDWLGTGSVASYNKVFRPFEEAHEFARTLGLKKFAQWDAYTKSGQKPDDIPVNPAGVYGKKWETETAMIESTNSTAGEQGEWRGWADWLGVVSRWTRTNLLAFLEDLRPHLEHLEEKELYAIIAQSGAMPALRGAFDKERPGRLIQDLKENEGREIEAAILAASEEQIEDAALSGEETSEEVVLGEVKKADAPPEDFLQGEDEPEAIVESGALPSLATPEGLRAVDDIAALHYGLDDETAEFLVRNRVAALWNAYITHGPAPVQEALGGEGGHYFGLIRTRFQEELEAVESLPIPAGWSFRPPGVGSDEPPTPPNLMQRRTAYEVLTRKRVGNWSGVGSGKTLAGILASRVADRAHTLVITNKATIEGWANEIRGAYPDSVVHVSEGSVPTTPPRASLGEHHYTLLNYDRFQLPGRSNLIQRLAGAGVDFVIFDEVQLVKQRDRKASIRRKAAEGLTSLLSEHIGEDLRVLGMSATPVINNLQEARKLLEIVQGRSFADLDIQATAGNALAVHRALMVYGFRYRPPYEAEVDLEKPTARGNELLDDLRQAEGVLGVEQTLLPAKLEAAREFIHPGVIIYSHYVEGMLEPIRRYVERLGYRAGFYTGSDKTGLDDFLAGRVDVLIGSKPVGTGLDGLQKVCNRIIAVSLPWTSAEWEQLEGRIRRQGTAFERVSMVVPQVVLEHKGEEWSWDKRRWRAIEYKRTLSDCATDGHIPETARMSPEKLLKSSREALEEWIKRIGGEELNLSEIRPHLRVPLPPDVKRKLVVTRGDFATFNNRWVSSNSETLNTRLKEFPEEWYLYHTLYREARAKWSEVPAEVIASHLRSRPDLIVGDFGCGECLLAEALGEEHQVIGFDHVAANATVTACDMVHTPLEDGALGAAVFSLSLMGRNWRDYLTEAHRALQPFGLLFIAEPAKRWEDGALERAVEAAGFDLLPSRRRGDFLYVRAVKS